MRRPLIFWLAAVICAGCAQIGLRADGGIFNAELRAGYARYDETMAARRPGLELASGRTVSNCAEYLAQGPSTAIGEGLNNRIVSQEYLVCDSIALLRQAGTDGGAGDRSPSYGEDLLHRLDLRSFPSSLRPLTDDRRFTLADVADGRIQIDANAVSIETDDWSYRVEIVADIAASGGGREWLLWFSDVAKKGNYRAYAVLVVRNPTAASLTAQALR